MYKKPFYCTLILLYFYNYEQHNYHHTKLKIHLHHKKMTANEFLQAKINIQNEQNAKFAEVAKQYLQANCPFKIGDVVEFGERKLEIQHIEPLSWFEFVMIRLYGTYDNGELEQNGITLGEHIKLSEPCQDKQGE